MTKLMRVLEVILADVEGVKLPVHKRIYHTITDKIDDVKRIVHYYDVKNFIKGLPRALRNAWKFRDWDYMYTIDEFADNLERLARSMRDGHHKNTGKKYKKAMLAAAKLRKAYAYSIANDVSYKAWSDANPISFRKLRKSDTLEVVIEQKKHSEAYSTTMFHLIHKRTQAVEKAQKQEAWAFVAKHIETFWD